jgi:hypothetical protein
MPGTGDAADENEPNPAATSPDETESSPAGADGTEPAPTQSDQKKPDREPRDWLGKVIIPVTVAFVAFGGVGLGSIVTALNNEDTITAQKDQNVEQFRRDQRQKEYANILQQATRLQNAGSFSTAAVASGLPLGSLAGNLGVEKTPPGDGNPGLAALGGSYGVSGYPYYYDGNYYRTGSSPAPLGNSWQDAYTGLDQAISNARIASSDEVINIARALRDKYRDDYYQSILANIDAVIARFPDPKPDKNKLADALVGVPANTSPPSYDVTWRKKSTDELTTMFVKAAQSSLDHPDH